MTNFFLITLIYALAVLAVSAVGGVLRLRYLRNRQQRQPNFFSVANDSTDENMYNLKFENPGSMVSVRTLARRGSWRVALDMVMSAQAFEEMKAEEYSRKL